VAYRYTDVNTRVVFSKKKGTTGQEGKIAKFWANAAGTDPIDIGLWSAGTPETPGASTGSNQLVVQSDSMWPAMWDRDGDLDHLWIQVGTLIDPGELYLVYCDADQRLDALATAVTALQGSAETPAGAQNKVDVHSADTTGVHGIADTELLETQTGAQTKATTAQSAAAQDATDKVAAEAAARTAADGLLTPKTRSVTAGAGLTGGGDLTADRTLAVAYGTTVGTAAQGNDGRLSDARNPTSHATSHASGGSDPITVAQAQVTGLTTALGAKADLVGGLVPTSQIPPSSVTFRGDVASQAAMLAVPAAKNDYVRRTDTTPNTFWTMIGTDPTQLSSWLQTSSAGAVSSVNSQSGNVVLGPADVGAVPANRAVSTTAPLTGGGALSGNLTLGVAMGTAAGTVAAGDDSRIVNATPGSRTISTTAPLAGGGDLSANRTLTVADATTGAKGVLQLAGDLAGTANAPSIAAGAVTSSKILDGTIVDGDISGSAAIAQSKVSGLTTSLAAKANKTDYWINVKDNGVVGNGTADDTAALQAILDAIPIAAGNEIGGACIFFPKGIYLINQVTSGILLLLSNKPNVTFRGVGDSSRIRTSSATADELLRIETCNAFKMENISIQAVGTARIGKAVHFTTATAVGSAHEGRFTNLKVSCNGAYRRAWDMMTTSGSPTVYSALAAFAAGDVGGKLMVNLTGGPWLSNITAVATLSATLAADINTTVTTVTLNAALPGAPSSGFTIQVETERMFVTAGGNTTTLTVTRARGVDAVRTAHLSGAAVVTYSATVDSNAPATVVNAAAPARIQPSGSAVIEVGLAIGTDFPGASTLDVANTLVIGYAAGRCMVAGIQVGNGTPANVLDHWAYGVSFGECGYGVYLTAGSLSIHGGDFSTNVIDYRRVSLASQECEVDGIRTEGPALFYEMTGAASSGPATRLSSIEIATFNAEDGVPIRHLNSASMLLENVNVTASRIAAATVLASISGTASNPCHLTAINVAFSGGNGDFFSSCTLPNTIKTIIGNPRLALNGSVSANSALGFRTDLRMQLGAGFVRNRTAVADANYTVLASDLTVAYTSLTAARVVTLPAQGASLPAGQEFTVKDESGACDGTKTITITPPSGTIDGAANLVLNVAYAKAAVYTNGANWFTR
jgi:hypothetical protein